MTETFKKYICSNCKGECKEGMRIEEHNGIQTIKCLEYIKDNDVEGYKKQMWRSAKQEKPIMRFSQEY